MAISVYCAECNKSYRASEQVAGKRVKCPAGHLLVVPPRAKSDSTNRGDRPPVPAASGPAKAPAGHLFHLKWRLVFAGFGLIAMAVAAIVLAFDWAPDEPVEVVTMHFDPWGTPQYQEAEAYTESTIVGKIHAGKAFLSLGKRTETVDAFPGKIIRYVGEHYYHRVAAGLFGFVLPFTLVCAGLSLILVLSRSDSEENGNPYKPADHQLVARHVTTPRVFGITIFVLWTLAAIVPRLLHPPDWNSSPDFGVFTISLLLVLTAPVLGSACLVVAASATRCPPLPFRGAFLVFLLAMSLSLTLAFLLGPVYGGDELESTGCLGWPGGSLLPRALATWHYLLPITIHLVVQLATILFVLTRRTWREVAVHGAAVIITNTVISLVLLIPNSYPPLT